jgi:hypothetical protein
MKNLAQAAGTHRASTKTEKQKKYPCAYSYNAQAGLQVLGQPNHASSLKRGQRLSGFTATQSQLRLSNPLCL